MRKFNHFKIINGIDLLRLDEASIPLFIHISKGTCRIDIVLIEVNETRWING